MNQEMICPLCKEELYSGLGQGCMMCGMPIEHEKEFCSITCKDKYSKINKLKIEVK